MIGKVYDPNMLEIFKENEDTDWYEVTVENFDIYGVISDTDELLSRRIPIAVAQKVNPGVLGQSGQGAGGRILFSTDSPFISIRAEYRDGNLPTVCNHLIAYGFDLYEFDGKQDKFVAAYRQTSDFDAKTAEFTGYTRKDGEMGFYTINFPHFAEVKKMYVGIKKGYKMDKGKKYVNEKPVVFYGSSITHGAAAGRPGNTYENFISQKYNIDYINLGFAGCAKGEQAMAEYIASLPMSVFVCDYDHNAKSVEHLENTHYPFYETIRKKHPDIPYIMISRPDANINHHSRDKHDERRDVIKKSYEKAIAAGDNNVYFIDGHTLFEGEFYESCTSDGVHPNDIGFMRMADKIGIVIAKVMNLIK